MRARTLLLLLMLALAAPGRDALATPMGSTFTYQGSLQQAGLPVTGNYDFVFTLCSVASGTGTVGTPQTVLNQPVTQGLFTVPLDFGAASFDGNARWLDIQVRPAGAGAYTTLTPRQAITAAPYALRALNGGGSSPWVDDGFDNVTYNGNVGSTGLSSHVATGTGVFLQGGWTDRSFVYGYDYTHSHGLPLYLNAQSGGSSIVMGYIAPPLPVPNARVEVDDGCYYGVRSRAPGSLTVPDAAAVYAIGEDGGPPFGRGAYGVYATSNSNDAIYATSAGSGHAGVSGISSSSGGEGGYFRNDGGGTALYADGLAKVRTLQILGADLAESFPVREAGVEPGTVLMMDDATPGQLRVADEACSRRVAGVVSGANGLDPAVVFQGRGFEQPGHAAVALTGRVWVKCDATFGAIAPGDQLTTSSHAGYAMRVADGVRADGAVLGKAMSALGTGTGFVLVLVSLR